MRKFYEVKSEFDNLYKKKSMFTSIVPVNLTINKQCKIKGKNNTNNEEYYKWQFIYSLIYSGLYSKDVIGVEVSFPKGNKESNPIRFDAAIFDSIDWFEHYKNGMWRKTQFH